MRSERKIVGPKWPGFLAALHNAAACADKHADSAQAFARRKVMKQHAQVSISVTVLEGVRRTYRCVALPYGRN